MTSPESARIRPHAHPRRATNWLPPALIGGLVLLGLGAWAFMATRPQPTLVVKRDKIVAYMALGGRVIAPPDAQATVRSPYHTTVKKVRATLNARVNKGEVLVELAIPSADQAVQSARESLQLAEANYDAARRGANANVAAAQEQLAAAQAAARAARAPRATTTDPEGSEVTVTETTPAPATADDDRIAAEQGIAQARSAAAAELAAARTAVDEARAYLREAQAGRAQGMVRAPIAGTVMQLNARPGETVGDDPKKVLAAIINLDRLQVHAPLAPAQMPAAKVETPVKLTSDSWPNKEIEGKIVQVTSVAGKDGQVTSYTAIIGFDNRDRLVRPDQVVAANIKLGVAYDATAVPNGALQKKGDGRYVVEAHRNGSWVEVPVEIGLSDGVYTEVKQGLRKGEGIRIRPSLLPAR
jgi:HlyD family secretion protein